MPDVLINCPETNREIPTGFAMDAESFREATLHDETVHCPQCNSTHTWNKEDAWVKGQRRRPS